MTIIQEKNCTNEVRLDKANASMILCFGNGRDYAEKILSNSKTMNKGLNNIQPNSGMVMSMEMLY